LIKGSKGSDSSKILPSGGWAPCQVTWAKMGPKTYLTYDVTHKRPETQIQKIFWLPTQRLAESSEDLNSTLAQSTGKLWSW